MKKRNFLVPLAAAIAAASQSSGAAVDDQKPSVQPADKSSNLQLPADDVLRLTLPGAGESKTVLVPSGEDLFSFLLRRTSAGQLVAQHESHYSHRSHSSHRSHYSSHH